MKILISILLLISTCLNAQDFSKIDALLWDGDAASALVQIEDALRTKPITRIAFTLQNKKAEALIRSGKFEEAQAMLNDLNKTTLTEPAALAIVKSNTGLLMMYKGRNDLALESFQQALQHWETAEKINTLEAAQTQSHLGNLFRATGKYTQAEEQLTIALLTRQKQLSASHQLIAASYNDLGLVYSFTDSDKALDYYEKALALYEQLHGKNHPKIAIANTNIAYVYNQLELYGDAINNYESALTIWEKVYPESHPAKGFVLFNLGETYQKMKDNKTARLYYDRALKTYSESYTGKHPDMARVYNALGNLDLSANEFSTALLNFQRALQANTVAFTSDELSKNPVTTSYYDGNVLLYSLLYKAQAFESRYYKKSLRFKDLEIALHTLHTCDTLIQKLRQQITSENDKITLGAVAYEVYTDGVRISMEAAAAAWRKESYLQKAFYFSEKSKAAVLLGALSEANAKSFAGIPNELLDEEKNLKSAIALCAQKLSQKPTEKEEEYLRETSYSLNRTYAAFTQRLEKDYPAYFNLKYNAESPTIKNLQQKLNGNTLLISYFIDDKNSRLYLFKITNQSYAVEEKSFDKVFERNITGLRNSVYFSELKTFKRTSEYLYTLLMPAKIPASIENLVIIPTGRLSTLPFESLLYKHTGHEVQFKELPYLIRKYSLRYEFSSGLILQKASAQKKIDPSILLCAPVNFMAREGLPELPGTEIEVNDIDNLFASQNFKRTKLLKAEADEKSIKAFDLNQYSYLHFATHGVVNEKNPELSKIFLQSASSAEDGDLYAGEIYNLQFNARLVTLSACETGLGKLSKGEGVIGLSRALVYAGAQNCIVSFWKVADESTSILMQEFYKELLQEPTYNLTATLKKAKHKLMTSEKYASPYYWAPFILIGF